MRTRNYWENWSGNLKYTPPTDQTSDYYYKPQNRAELEAIVNTAAARGDVVLRVSGQRHSQPPLVIHDNRENASTAATPWLIDMSCYADLGPEGDKNIVIDDAACEVTVNTGVMEYTLVEALTERNLMLKTVTAGGFFSMGGETVIDVHGATHNEGIVAETVVEYTILKANGEEQIINESTTEIDGWVADGDLRPIDLVRVNLGVLGIVTSVKLAVMPRPYATTLEGGVDRRNAVDKETFIDCLRNYLQNNDRIEVYYDPYEDNENMLILRWRVNDNPDCQLPNQPVDPGDDACDRSGDGKFGAGKLPNITLIKAQNEYDSAKDNCAVGMNTVFRQATKANDDHSELWLTTATRVMFLGYFIELPNLDEAGLGKVWDALQVVADKVNDPNSEFYPVAPMEFRFIKSGRSAMAGTFSENSGTTFVNIGLVGAVKAQSSSNYPEELRKYFAEVEYQWVNMGGFPHHGKMYGFYDPAHGPEEPTDAFNPNFIAMLRERYGDRLTQFNAFRQAMDPDGLFYNDYMCNLLEG